MYPVLKDSCTGVTQFVTSHGVATTVPCGILDGLRTSVRILRNTFRRTVMTTLRKLCAATMLLFALSVSGLAGTIHTDAVPPPPPPPASAMAVGSADTTVPLTEKASETERLIAGISLSVLQLLSVF